MPESDVNHPLVLLIDDNSDDVLLVRRAFNRAGLNHRIESVSTAAEGIAYLNGSEPYHDRSKYPLPSLVLLDLNLPMVSGLAVLKWIRRQPKLSQLCVVMLTSSDDVRDVNLAHQHGANSFLVKPLEFWSAAELSASVGRFLRSENPQI